MNPLENPEILSPEIFQAIRSIKHEHSDIVFGGSTALNARGLISRPIGDLDLIFPQGKSLLFYGDIAQYIINDVDEEDMSLTVEEQDGTIVTRVKAIINGVKTCMFKIPTVRYSEFHFSGITIKLQEVEDILNIKKLYSIKDTPKALKHIEDLQFINHNNTLT